MAVSDRSEREIIAACTRGDELAWRMLYERYHGPVSRAVAWAGWSFSRSEQEELVQDVFLELVKVLPAFRFQSSLATFVTQIARNRCISLLRSRSALKRGGREESLDPLEDGGAPLYGDRPPEPLSEIISREEEDLLRRTFENLSLQCREILALRYYEEKSYEEISRKLSLPLGTTCSRLKRCVTAFRRAYERLPASL